MLSLNAVGTCFLVRPRSSMMPFTGIPWKGPVKSDADPRKPAVSQHPFPPTVGRGFAQPLIVTLFSLA